MMFLGGLAASAYDKMSKKVVDAVAYGAEVAERNISSKWGLNVDFNDADSVANAIKNYNREISKQFQNLDGTSIYRLILKSVDSSKKKLLEENKDKLIEVMDEYVEKNISKVVSKEKDKNVDKDVMLQYNRFVALIKKAKDLEKTEKKLTYQEINELIVEYGDIGNKLVEIEKRRHTLFSNPKFPDALIKVTTELGKALSYVSDFKKCKSDSDREICARNCVFNIRKAIEGYFGQKGKENSLTSLVKIYFGLRTISSSKNKKGFVDILMNLMKTYYESEKE